MQKAKHIQGKLLLELENNITDFIKVFNPDIKTMSIMFDPIMQDYHAMIIYEDK